MDGLGAGRLQADASPVRLKPAASHPKERRDIPRMGQVYPTFNDCA